MIRGKAFDEMQVGDRASFRKTISESDIYLYAGITGDFNPVHVDGEYAQNTVFGRRIAHGMLTGGLVSTVLGNMLPGPGTVYLSQTIKFIHPVYFGDTITAEVEITGKIDTKKRVCLRTTCYNQEGKTVLEGDAVVRPAS